MHSIFSFQESLDQSLKADSGKNGHFDDSRNFIENERGSPVTNSGSSGNYGKPTNPFKKQSQAPKVICMPAGCESEDEDYDEYDFY